MAETKTIETVITRTKPVTDPAFTQIGVADGPVAPPEAGVQAGVDWQRFVYRNDPVTGLPPMSRPAPVSQTPTTVLATDAPTVSFVLSADIELPGKVDYDTVRIAGTPVNCNPSLDVRAPRFGDLNPDAAFLAGLGAGVTQNASFDWTVDAADENGTTASVNGTFTQAIQGDGVIIANQPPVLAIALPNVTILENTTGGRTSGSFTLANNHFTDPDGDTLTLSAVENGQSSLPAGVTFDPLTRSFVYDLDGDFSGAFVIVVTADDGNGGTATGPFTLSVAEQNDPPQSSAPVLTMTEATTSSNVDWITGFVTDVESDTPYTITAAAFRSGASVGTVAITTAGTLLDITLNAGQVGDFFVDYTIEDARAGQTNITARVTGAAAAGPTPLSIADTSTTTAEDSGDIIVDFSASITPGTAAIDPASVFIMDDWDANVFAGRVVTIPGVATITASLTEHKFTIARVPNYNGPVVFRYRESDVNGLVGNWAAHTETSTPVNDPPVLLSGQTFSVNEGATLVVDVSAWASDVDTGDTLSITAVSALIGTVDQIGLSYPFFRYIAHADNVADDTISLTISDGTVSVTDTVTATIVAQPDAPRVNVALSTKSLSAENGAVVGFSIPVTDPDAGADVNVVVLSQPPLGGSLSISKQLVAPGSWTFSGTYTAPSQQTGADDFTLQFIDNTLPVGLTVDYTIPVTVSAPPPPPPAQLPAFTGEIPSLISTMITMAMNPLFVTGANAQGEVAGDYSGGALPTAADPVVIVAGAKLTINDGVTVNCDFMRADGELDIKPGGKLICDTLIVTPTGTLTGDATKAKNAEIQIRNSSDIDIVRDPMLVSRGVLICDGAIVRIQPTMRIRQLPITSAITAGVTTQVTLGHPIFIGAAAGGGEDDVLIDWDAADKLIFCANEAEGTIQSVGNIGEDNEVAEILSTTISNTATAFALNDPVGTTVTVTQALVNKHPIYFDQAALDDVWAKGPPPRPGEALSSHANWLGLPHVLNVSRYFKFTVTDQAAPIHRRPMIFINSPDVKLEWAEVTFFGRTNLRTPPIDPGSQTHTPTDNVKHRNPVQFYRAGYTTFADTTSPVATAEGCSVWGGAIGDTFANSDQGAGSPGHGFAQYNCEASIIRCIAHNAIGTPFMSESRTDIVHWIRNQGCEAWGRNVAGGEPLHKDGTLINTNDLGIFGDGFFSMSRAIDCVQCQAYGVENAGLVIMPRGNESNLIDPQFLQHPHEMHGFKQFAGGPENFKATEYEKSALNIEGFYAAGCGIVFYTTKLGPRQDHQYHSQLKNIVGVNCKGGIGPEYVFDYVIENLAILGIDPTGKPSGFFGDGITPYAKKGVVLGTNTGANYIIRPYFAHLDEGVVAEKLFTYPAPTDDELGLKVLNADFGPGVTTQYVNLSGNEILTIAETVDTTFGLTLSETPGDWRDGINEVVNFRGTLTCGLGSFLYPLGFAAQGGGTGERVDITRNIMFGLLYKDGYYTDSVSGDTFVHYPLVITNPLDNQFRTALYPVKTDRVQPDPFNNKWFESDGVTLKTTVNNGTRDLAADLTAALAVMAVQ